MNASEVIEFFGQGSVSKAAKAIPVSRQAIYVWKRVGISEQWQLKLQKRTKGALKADKWVNDKYREFLRAA